MKNDTLHLSKGTRRRRALSLFAITTLAAGGVLLPRQAAAQSFLPLPAPQASTVPANGDVNPYGVAFVPASVPADGALKHNAILVSNFNNSANLQGTGTTIVQITPQGETSLFFTSTQPGLTGMTAALGVLSNGIVLAGYLPSTDGTFQTAGPGGIFVLDRSGVLLGKLSDPTVFNGPWGMAVNDPGEGLAQVFVSNVETGTVVRMDLAYTRGGEALKILRTVTIGSGFQQMGDAAAFELGPSGLAYDAAQDLLFVASEVDSSVYAIAGAGTLTASAGTGTLVYQDQTHLHGPLDLALLPNGHLLTANSDGHNADPKQPSELVEFNGNGQFVSQFSVDPNNGGAFGVAIHSIGTKAYRVAAVDDNQNVLNIWTVVR